MKINYETNNNFFYQTQVCCVVERAVEKEEDGEDEATYVVYKGHWLKCSYEKELTGIPDVIVERMLFEQKLQGNKPDARVFEEDLSCAMCDGGFYWESTELGDDAWESVLCYNNFKPFFDKYPIK